MNHECSNRAKAGALIATEGLRPGVAGANLQEGANFFVPGGLRIVDRNGTVRVRDPTTPHLVAVQSMSGPGGAGRATTDLGQRGRAKGSRRCA